jgi:hypothetical protein
MIHPDLPMFCKLEQAPMAIYQTGSRYIGFHKESSDWDFLTNDTAEAREWLLTNGFKHSTLFVTDPAYNDGFTNAVLEAYDGNSKLQVQLTPQVEAKLAARNVIKHNLAEAHFCMSTDARITLWKAICQHYMVTVAQPV